MSFEKAKSIEGQKNTKGYQESIEMLGTLKKVYPAEFNKSNGKKQQGIEVLDECGTTEKIKIWLCKNADMHAGQVDQKFAFTVSPNPYQDKMYYSGFWNSNTQVAQGQAPATPASQPQTYTPVAQAPPAHSIDDNIKFGQACNLAMAECTILNNIDVFECLQSKYYYYLTNRKMAAIVNTTVPAAGAAITQDQYNDAPNLDEDGVPF